MVYIRLQLIVCVALVISSIALGIWLKRRPSKVVAQSITPIFHVIFVGTYLLSFVMVLTECAHYDEILGIPSLPFQSVFKVVGTVMIYVGVFLLLISGNK